MEGELAQPEDPNQLRVSHAERDKVAEILRVAAGEGRLDLDELDQRLEAAYAARTYADLVPITFDLPVKGERPQQVDRTADSSLVTAGPAHEKRVVIFSGLDLHGEWVVPEHLTVLTIFGGVSLDLREARFAARDVVVTINAYMGGATIVVGPHINVVIDGTAIMGGYSGPSGLVESELNDDSPTVRVNGLAIWGGVSVERKRMPKPGKRPPRGA